MSRHFTPEVSTIAIAPNVLEPPLTTVDGTSDSFDTGKMVGRSFGGVSGDLEVSTEEVKIGADPLVTLIEEPVVTRKELWSYYCKYRRNCDKNLLLICII
jgi:hypothetical protein